MSSIYNHMLPPLVIQNSDDGQTIIIKPVGGQVIADFPRDDEGLQNAEYLVHCANHFMAALEELKNQADALDYEGYDATADKLRRLVKTMEEV